ncbi:MAG TPA: hypothetical protein VH393_05885 [Ktedonobacterales bacterium]
MAGILLILSGVSFAIGAGFPIFGPKGNSSIYTLPVRAQLQAITNNTTAWHLANVFMGIAIIFLLAGLWMLTAMLVQAGERIFSRLGLVTMLVAAGLWVVFSVYRGVVTVQAAQEMSATGAVPAYYESLAPWGFRLFYVYAVLAFLALAAYSVSLLQVSLFPAWVGWATLIYSLALLILLFIMGDTLPLFDYLPALLIGALLLIAG